MRSPDEFPTQSVLMRYGSPYPRKTSRKAPPNFVAAIKNADNEGAEKLETVLVRKNKFCGGVSKPYKKNPLKRTVGVGNKSIKERIQEYGKKQKEENSSSKPSISKKMRPIPVSHTISSNIKKKPALPRKNKYKKK